MHPDELPRFVDRIRSVFFDLQAADADELVQDVLVAMILYVGDGRVFDDDEKIVFRAAQNIRCDHFRRRARRRKRLRAVELTHDVPDNRFVFDAELRDLVSAGLRGQPSWLHEIVLDMCGGHEKDVILASGYSERQYRRAVVFLHRLLGGRRSRKTRGKAPGKSPWSAL